MNRSSARPNQRLLRVLLLVCSISLTCSLFLGAYFVVQFRSIASLRARLLAENELQAELLSGQPERLSVMPHAIQDVAFALNPALESSTLWAPRGESYPINSIGLRGPEIAHKPVGITRVVIVGDSMVFGWKLSERDRLSGQLSRYVAERPGVRDRVEFATVALPGWNLRSQIAFLEGHLRRLDPDLLVWFSPANDIEETAGVIPPGRLAAWASPHRRNDTAFNRLSRFHRADLVMPTLTDRRAANVQRMAAFYERHRIPIAILSLQDLEQHRSPSFDPRRISIPPEYRHDERWPIGAADGHPSSWANRILALGILREMIEMELIPALEFDAADRAILERFDEVDGDRIDAAPPRPLAETALAEVPTTCGDPTRAYCVLYGVGRRGELGRAGTLFLRDPGRSSHLRLTLGAPRNIESYPGTVDVSVTSRDRQRTHTRARIETPRSEIRVLLPRPAPGPAVYEVSWLFDYLECGSPLRCSAARLLEIRFE
jgi:hypothetical protein